MLATAVSLVALWWFTFGDDTADTTPWGGLDRLVDGILQLPGMIIDLDAYRSWWSYMSEQEGWGEIFASTVDHAQLVLFSLTCASLIAITLGVLIYRVTTLRAPLLGFFSIMLTVPSLAMFAIFIPISFIGIGDRGPLIALTLYSILPILRNTVTGLEEVDSAVVESAKGMGLSPVQRLLRIELPLAWPVILTGMRVAALLNIGIAAIAVLVGGTGLGTYIDQGLNRFPAATSVERIWTGVVFTILLALVFDLAFNLLRRLTSPKGLTK
ncbi:MAG: ABC transporter permease [Acidimicrobiales bacterium]